MFSLHKEDAISSAGVGVALVVDFGVGDFVLATVNNCQLTTMILREAKQKAFETSLKIEWNPFGYYCGSGALARN